MAEQRLDVSEMEAPEPLVLAVEAIRVLPTGDFLRLLHRMKPCHLYRFLEENGFQAETRHGRLAECEVFIWQTGDTLAEEAAVAEARQLSPWEE
jgi:hypothetical protein